MSKIPKDQNIGSKIKKTRKTDEKFAYRTVIISAVLGIIFYIFSLLLNLGFVSIFNSTSAIFGLIDGLIKVVVILLFFLFMMISIGNFKELTGKPLDWKELFLLLIVSLMQTILNLGIFIFTLIGLIIILIYLYLIQEI
ncbi:MAG: hypothetical protein ACXABO_06695 [Promethearchaeota archaeon]|jgi:hypothetical protein